jgi:hypothetical protein
MRRESRSLKVIVNKLLRKGLRVSERPLAKGRPARIETFASSFAPGIAAGKLNQLNDELEIAEFLRKHRRERP